MITRNLMEIALTRNEPKIMNKIKERISHSRKISEFGKKIDETGSALLEKDMYIASLEEQIRELTK